MKIMCLENTKRWCEHMKTLSIQGIVLASAASEREDVVWKSFMYNLKQGTLKFLLNALLDTLLTAANLVR